MYDEYGKSEPVNIVYGVYCEGCGACGGRDEKRKLVNDSRRCADGRRLPQMCRWKKIAADAQIEEDCRRCADRRRLPQMCRWKKIAADAQIEEDGRGCADGR